MKFIKHPRWRYITLGEALGFLAAFTGSILFETFGIIEYAMANNIGFERALHEYFDVVIFGILFLATTLPGVLGGALLGLLLYKDAAKENLSPKKSLLRGSLLGAFTSIVLCLLVLAWTGQKFPVESYLIESCIAILLGSLAGGWTGWQLVKVIQHKSNLRNSTKGFNET